MMIGDMTMEIDDKQEDDNGGRRMAYAVSYTHLTLPTTISV